MRFNRHRNDHKTGKAATKLKCEVEKANKGWHCDLCGKSGSSYSSLKRHESAHKGPEETCKFCERKYQFKGTLLKHEKTCQEKVTKECLLCGKQFPSLSALK